MSMAPTKQVVEKKSRDALSAPIDLGLKFPPAEKDVIRSAAKVGCPFTVDLFQTPGGPGSGGQSAIQSMAEKVLGVLVMAKILSNPFGNHKVALEEVLSKAFGLEEKRTKSEDLLAKRTKQSILTEINLENLMNLANNQRSLPILSLATSAKLPPAIKLKQPEGQKHESATV